MLTTKKKKEVSGWGMYFDKHYPRILRLLGVAAVIVGIVLETIGAPAGGAVIGLAGTLITAGVSAEALRLKE